MSEMEPVEQVVRAELSGYVEPIQGEGVAATEELASAVSDLNGTLDDLAGTADATGTSVEELAAGTKSARDQLAEMGITVSGALNSMEAVAQAAAQARNDITEMGAAASDAAGSTETLAEAQARFRDKVYEANPGIDEQTASLLADAAAMQALGLSAEETAGTINRTQDYEALRNALFDLEAGESILVGRNGDLTVGFMTMDGAAAGTSAALDEVGVSGGAAAGGLTAAGGAADSAAASFSFMGPAIAIAVIAALGPVAALATSVLAIGSAVAFVLPDIRGMMNALTGTGQKAPSAGPVAQAVAEVHQLGAAWKQIAADSGLQGDFLAEIPQVAHTIENLLFAVEPLAKAGATSIDEIVSALDRVSGSAGFSQFVQAIAADAPSATEAVINLAGAVGGDLAKVLEALAPQASGDTNAIAGLVTELGGPLATAVTVAGGGLHGLIDSFDAIKTGVGGVLGPLTAVDGPLKGIVNDMGGAAHATETLARGIGVTLAGPLALGLLIPRSNSAASALKNTGTAAAGAGHSASAAAPPMSAFARDMAAATNEANSLANRVTNLTNALTIESGATDTALGNIVTFHQGLATLSGDLVTSGDRAGYFTKAQLAAAGELAVVDAQARAASAGILQTGGSAAAAARPLEDMRGVLERLHDPTAAEREMLHELNVEIAALRSKTVTIGVQTIYSSAGHPVFGVGAPGHVPLGPGGPAPQIVLPRPAGAGTAPAQVHVNVNVSGAGFHLADPRFLQALHPAIEETVLRVAHLNQSSGMHFGGSARGI